MPLVFCETHNDRLDAIWLILTENSDDYFSRTLLPSRVPCLELCHESTQFRMQEKDWKSEQRYSLVELWCFFLVVPISAPCFLQSHKFFLFIAFRPCSFVIFLQFFSSTHLCCCVFSNMKWTHPQLCGVAIKTDNAVKVGNGGLIFFLRYSHSGFG
jgi:hypothetical protein